MDNKYTLLLVFISGVILSYMLFKKDNTQNTLMSPMENIKNNDTNHNNIKSNDNFIKYKNNERWHVVRDEHGNLIDIEIVRDAKIT